MLLGRWASRLSSRLKKRWPDKLELFKKIAQETVEELRVIYQIILIQLNEFVIGFPVCLQLCLQGL